MSEYREKIFLFVFTWVILVIAILSVSAITPFIWGGDAQIEMKVFYCFWAILFILTIRYFIKMPYMIVVNKADQLISFRALFSHKDVAFVDLISIKMVNRAYVIFNHTNGKIVMRNSIGDFRSLLDELRELNSKIETKGC